MLRIDVELLTGRYCATAYNDRTQAEWPPHPARLFSGLVAVLHDSEPCDESERNALLWLEQQDPPRLRVALEHAGFRSVDETFVPVNDITLTGDLERQVHEVLGAIEDLEGQPVAKERDKALKRARKQLETLQKRLHAALQPDETPSKSDLERATALLPERRTRQARTFPVVVPVDPLISFVWSAEPPKAVRSALDRVCARLVRLGHSSSLVRCVVHPEHVNCNWVPRAGEPLVLRTIQAGQLARLEAAHARHRGVENRILPAAACSYGPPGEDAQPPPCGGVFSADDWIVFERVGGARLTAGRGPDLARALRAALLEQAGTHGLPAALCGHDERGQPTDRPHLAFVALPFVGHEFADGSVQGCAVIVPRHDLIGQSERDQLLRLIAQLEMTRAVDGRGTLEIAAKGLPRIQLRRTEFPAKRTLRPDVWARPASQFVTATPIALDRFPGPLHGANPGAVARAAIDAQRTIADACERIGLPRPAEVEISPTSLLAGAPSTAACTPRGTPRGRPTRVRVHARLRFDVLVQGPVILGAGRFFGLGLCLPIRSGAPQ